MFSRNKSKLKSLTAMGAALAVLTFSSVSATAATLSTGLTENNGQRGVMFNIETGSSALVLESLATDFFVGTTAAYEIYYTIGDFTAVQNSPEEWTLLDSISDFTGTAGLQSWDFVDLLLPANETIGLYVTNTFGGGIRYANGTAVGSTLASDDNLTIFGGVGRSYAFGSTFSPRNFVGSLDYSVAAVPLPAGLPLLLAGLGGLGLVQRRRR